ncbi:MAG TPA: protein kinase [Albitalea sp.]|uniref:serine/threonine protein kinase n=1 Tax=Piscinibacter sp. TaxID=1903157 RepID=UPI002ED6165D
MAPTPPSDAARKSARARPGEHGQFVGSSAFLGHTLPEGTRIGGLEITGLIGEGGFGIVYLAYDASLQRELAVKEYMPSSLASRASGSLEVTVKSERHVETFKAGLKSFVNEARLLARFDHPSLLKVYRFWEANGTAYMAMPYYEGQTLKATLAAMAEPPDEDQLRRWLAPLLDALDVMHQAHCFHRDIAPDNILLTPDGPLLLDFGAARRVIGDMTHALTVVLKPGYAPIEQYGDSPAMTQGAWTDLYALACVIWFAVSGKTPPSSVERMMGGDPMESLASLGRGRYSEPFVRAVDAALKIMPRDRPQSLAQFRALLDAGRNKPAAPRGLSPRAIPLPPPAPPPPDSSDTTVVTAAPAVVTAARTERRTALPAEPELSFGDAGVVPSAGPRLPVLWLLALAGLAAATAGAILLVDPRPPATPVAAEPQAAPAPAVAAAASAVAVPIAAQATPIAAPEAVASAPEPTPVAATPALASGTTELPPAPAVEASAVPVIETTESHAAAVRPAPESRRPARVSAAAAAPPMTKAKPARCSDILQKASLEPLTAEEEAFLRRDCR